MDKIVQNYYGNGRNQQYNGQKQKYYCAVCKIEIAPSKTSIMFHNQSQSHKQKEREAIERSSGKRQQRPMGNIQQMKEQQDSSVMEELKRIEEAAFQSYDKNDATGFRYKKLDRQTVGTLQGNMQQQKQGGRRNDDIGGFDQDMGYQKPRRGGKDDDAGQTFSVEDIQNDPIWSSHYDDDSGEVYYYNRLTKKSHWDKPSNFDGYDIMSGQGALVQDNEYYRTFGQAYTQATQLEPQKNHAPADQGVPGGWEEVQDEQDYFKQHSLANLNEEERRKLEKIDQECRAKTLQEIQQEQDSEEDDDGENMNSDENEQDQFLKRQIDKQRRSNKDVQQTVLGKRKFQRRKNQAQLVNATENDIQKETLNQMRKMVEKNVLDEDFKKESYLDKTQKDGDIDIPSNSSNISGGFKKRESKVKDKKRKIETSDGELD